MTVTNLYYIDNHFSHLETSGHSGYAESGSDIVCSAITTALMTTIGILEHLGYKLDYKFKDGYLSLKVLTPNKVSDNVIEGLLEALKNIELDYSQFYQIKTTRR